MSDPPDALPYALAHDAHALGPPAAGLVLERRHAVVHLPLAQLSAVAAGSADNVGEAKAEELRHLPVLLGGAWPRGDAAGVEQLPEEVGGVGVGMAGAGGLDARVEADEEDEQVRGDGVGEQRQMGIGGRRSIGGALALPLDLGRRGGGAGGALGRRSRG